LTDSSQPRTPQTLELHQLVDGFLADTEAAAKARASGIPRGPVSGLKDLDEKLGGYFAPGLHVLQGGPGAGKTAFALQIASRCYYPCLYVTAEMPALELFRRLIARETKTFLGKLKSGEISGKDARRLALATVEKLPHLVLMDAGGAYAAPSLIQDVAEAMREQRSVEHVLVIIDSLQVWSKGVRSLDSGLAAASEYDLINAALISAEAIAQRLNCPVMMISHRNRVGQDKGGLHASKGSGDIEYMTESVIDLTAKKDQQQDANGDTEVTAHIVKNRHNAPNVYVPLRFCGRLQEFKEQ
jgi:replicative DNA helicase